MSGSKTSKKNGGICKYIFTKGKRDGEECGKPARGDRCCDHNDSKKNYIKKYNDKKSKRNTRDLHKLKVKKLKKMSINKIVKIHQSLRLRCRKFEQCGFDWQKKYFAMIRIIDPNNENLKIFQEKRNFNTFGVYADKFSQLREYSDSEIKKISEKIKKMLEDKNKIILKLKQYKEYLDIVEKRLSKEKPI